MLNFSDFSTTKPILDHLSQNFIEQVSPREAFSQLPVFPTRGTPWGFYIQNPIDNFYKIFYNRHHEFYGCQFVLTYFYHQRTSWGHFQIQNTYYMKNLNNFFIMTIDLLFSIFVIFLQDENDKSGHLAKLYLRELRMQSFMYKAANSWGPTFQCSATGTYRDETAPIIVGSVLSLTTVCVVIAYGLWRYFKVKKVQYGTMA